jgi:hypothetical protein
MKKVILGTFFVFALVTSADARLIGHSLIVQGNGPHAPFWPITIKDSDCLVRIEASGRLFATGRRCTIRNLNYFFPHLSRSMLPESIPLMRLCS